MTTYRTPAGGCCEPVETDAPIAVVVNPEARVNVGRTGAPLGELTTGEWHTVDVAVVNDGFVCGPLSIEAHPVRGVDLDLPVHELTGEPHQSTTFRVRLESPVVADVTLTFRVLTALGGLANHSSVHLLLRAT